MSNTNHTIERPPVVAVMGHVDHGKSSLLDYIRKTNIVDGEAGGITQHVSAYEVHHTNADGDEKRITFIDTPGHAAFSGMRARGAAIADIAILIVSAEDSVKTQTIEAIQIIKDSGVPYVVAINKIDKPGANVEKVKMDLMEHEIFLEGYGGDVPYAEISAKIGTGVDDLLETILILAELQEFTGDPTKPAEGFVVESHQDPQRGTTATLIIKDGSLKKGQFVVAGCGMASTRMLQDFNGNNIEEALFSSPIRVVGFSSLCSAGSIFTTYDDKKEAENDLDTNADNYTTTVPSGLNLNETRLVPIILKCDVAGMIEPVANEIEKLSGDGIFFKIIKTGVGSINESDAQIALSDDGSLILGFNVAIDPALQYINGIETVERETFSIIYKLSEWLEAYKEKNRQLKEVQEVVAKLKVLKVFSNTKQTWVAGGRVTTGILKKGAVHIMRRDEYVASGSITGLQQAKTETNEVSEGNECGFMLETNGEVQEGDTIELYINKHV